MTLYAAQLRVYEPLAAFEGEQRRRWAALAGLGDAATPAQGAQREHEAAVRASVGRPHAVVPEVEDEAYVLEVDGVTLVSPWRTTARSWEALGEFVSGLPAVVADAFAPPEVVADAEERLAAWVREHGSPAVGHALTSTWQVPLRWFVAVDADERVVATGEPGTGAGAPPGRRTGRSLVYRTPMSRARRRVARALQVLRAHLDEGAVTDGVEQLGRWLEEFHPRSLVELDYGGLVHLLDDAELAQDESARDVASALALLAEGDGEGAAAAYGRVTARMKALQAVESAN